MRFRIAPVVFSLGAAACAPGGEQASPNLLLITIDTLRADHLGTYGYARDTSTHIDRFAQDALVFERAYSSSSWTLPALSSLMTSQPVSTHRCTANESRLRDSFPTLAECLAQAGYRTGAVTTHVFLAERHGLAQGFADYDDELVSETLDVSHEAITSPAITARGLAWLERRSQESHPWFLWLHYFDPHDRYLTHPSQAERFGTREPVDRYDGEIAFTDASVGRVLERLAELDLEARTVVVIVADHGEEFGDHGGTGHRNTLYEEVLRVPLLVRAPGIAARRIAQPVAMVDLFPTLLGLLDVPAPTGLAGLDLAPTLAGAGAPPRRPILGELGAGRWDALIDGRWKLVRRRGRAPVLFDLASDPAERRDRSQQFQGRVSAMNAELSRLQRDGRRRSDAFGELTSVRLSVEETRALEALGYAGQD